MNHVILTGNLGKDPETKIIPSGAAITNFSIAVTKKIKKGDNWEDKTDWFNIVAFNNKLASDYLKKGSRIAIEGELVTNSWTDESGKTNYKIEIKANKIENFTPRDTQQQKQESQGDDLPF